MRTLRLQVLEALGLLLWASLARGASDGQQDVQLLRRSLVSDTDGYDVGGKAAICWETTNPGTKNATVSRMLKCPTDVTISFETPPPVKMFAGQKYPVVYRFSLNPNTFTHYQFAVKGKKWDVPHANIHSCVSTVGFCTPFIGNTPGLATHTPALYGNIQKDSHGDFHSVDFTSDVVLNPSSYTIIAHIRFFGSNGTIQYDIAGAVFRDVLPYVHVLTVTPAIQYAMLVVICLGAAFLLTVFACLVYYRKHKVLKASQVNILIAMDLVGLVSVAALPLYAWPSTLSCNLRPWLVNVPLNLMFGLLFGKTWRIWRLMNNKGFKALRITEYQVFLVALALTFVEIAMYALEAGLAPLSIDLKTTVNSSTFIHYCKGDGRALVKAIHLANAAVILAIGCLAANESSKLTTLFNEGKYIGQSIYTCAVLSLIIVPASFAVSGDPTVGYILTVMGIVMSVCGTIGAINVPKILVIRSGVEISITDGSATKTTLRTSAAASPPGATRAALPSSPASTGPPGSAKMGHSVPPALFHSMKNARDALGKVVTRQEQGFAAVPADVDDLMAKVDALAAMLTPYKPGPPGASSESKQDKGPAGTADATAAGGDKAGAAVVVSSTTNVVQFAATSTSELDTETLSTSTEAARPHKSVKVVPAN